MRIIQLLLLLFLFVVTYTTSVFALDAPVITATAKGPNQIDLTWSAVADAGYGYKIEIQSSADSRYSSWTEIATIPYWVTESHYKDPQDNTASQYPVFSLRNNTSYSFRVRSYNGDTSPAYSSYSNTATTTTRNYTAYYVNSTTGADNSTCGTFASPCATINYAIYTRDLATSGRVIIISGGNYANDYIHPIHSGSSGVDNKIVIMAEPGSAVNITSSSLSPIAVYYNYVVIDGITVTSDYNDNMVYISGSNNVLADCEFDGSGNVSWGPFISGSYNLVHGVYSHDFGSANIDAGSAMQTVGATTGANYNIIQYSLLRRGSHDTALTKNNASYNQWMNNVMDGGWGIGWAVVSDSFAACTNNLFEGNIIRDTAKNKTITNYKPGIQISGDYNTIRRNLILDGNRTGTNSNPSPGIEISRLVGYGAHHNLIYNNAIYHNGGRAIVFMDGVSLNDNIIANNIMYYNYGDTTYCPNSLNVHIRGITTNTVVHHNQILYKDWTTGIENPNQANMILYSDTCMTLSTAESNYGGTFYNNVTATPDFVSEGSDFHLNSNSQLIDAGQVVIDATWGTLGYKGSAPDIGVYEYCGSGNCSGSGNTTPSPSSSSGGDSGGGSGGGCGFVRDSNSNGVLKSQSIKVVDIGLMILLFLVLFLYMLSKAKFRRLFMRRSISIFLLGLFLLLSPTVSVAAVNLPWSTTYNCPEWTESGLDNVNCDGLQRAGGWACDNGDGTVRREQITASANYSGGAGGKGQRHWMGDGVNNISGGLWPYFISPQSEIWIRWYMRYEQGFQWAELVNQKILYFDSITFPRLIVEYYGPDKVQIYSYAVNQGWPSVGNGWNVIMANGGTDANGNKTSDGQWHLWEFHVKIDTNGSNGILELWVDQKKVININNANLAAAPLTNVLIGSNGFTPGNGRCMYIDYDDIAISNTGPIGPIGGDTGGNTGGNGGDSSASGGSGCGFVKEDGKGHGAKGEGLALMIMLIIALKIISVTLRRFERRRSS